jgi:hypothetical protein
MHFKEDTAKPENRTNLALLACLQVPELRTFLLEKLGLPDDVLIWPCPNMTTEEFAYPPVPDAASPEPPDRERPATLRPDFVVKDPQGADLAYIEVELGPENKAQLANYRWNSTRILSIVGKESYVPKNLSLESLHGAAEKSLNRLKGTQAGVSLALFCKLVKFYAIDGPTPPPQATGLSAWTEATLLVQRIRSEFGNDIVDSYHTIVPGKLMLNSIGERGLSVRVHSKVAKDKKKGFSLMYRQSGGTSLTVPSLKRLQKYLPGHGEALERYAQALDILGATGILDQRNDTASLLVTEVENKFDQIAPAMALLIKPAISTRPR